MTETLAEGRLPGGNGADLGAGESMDLGNMWIRNPIEDIGMRLLSRTARFIRRPSSTKETKLSLAISAVTASRSGRLAIFRTGLGRSGDDLTLAQAYGMGDLDADGDTDIVDFRTSKQSTT